MVRHPPDHGAETCDRHELLDASPIQLVLLLRLELLNATAMNCTQAISFADHVLEVANPSDLAGGRAVFLVMPEGRSLETSFTNTTSQASIDIMVALNTSRQGA